MSETCLLQPETVLEDVFDRGGRFTVFGIKLPVWTTRYLRSLPARGIGQVTGAYDVVKITVSSDKYAVNAGDYALLYRGDFLFAWDNQLLVDPWHNLSDDDLDKLSDDDPLNNQFFAFIGWIETIQNKVVLDPRAGYTLYKTCLDVGYKPSKNGYNLVFWMMNYIGRKVADTHSSSISNESKE